MTTDAQVYPVAAEFETNMQPHLDKLSFGRRLRLQFVYNSMRENIGEYEHGTADVDDVFEGIEGLPGVPRHDPDDLDYDDRPDQARLLKVYAAVCEDLLLTIIYTGEDPLL
jgi:hypothetical protein